MIRKQTVLGGFALLFACAAGVLLARPDVKGSQGAQAHPLIPCLPTGSGENGENVSFAIDVTNDTKQGEDLDSDFEHLRMVLDGKRYALVSFLGRHQFIHPGKTRSFGFSIDNFRMDEQQNGVTLLPLQPGRHTVSILFGGKEYGPLTFVWREDKPLGKK